MICFSVVKADITIYIQHKKGPLQTCITRKLLKVIAGQMLKVENEKNTSSEPVYGMSDVVNLKRS